MADEQGIVLGQKAIEQIAKTVREVSRRMMNEQPHRGRWQKGGGGGIKLYHGIITRQCSETCSTYEVQLVHRYVTAECDDCY